VRLSFLGPAELRWRYRTMSKTVIQLEVPNGRGTKRSAKVLLNDPGSILAVDDTRVELHCSDAGEAIGYGPVIPVAPETIGMFRRNWGPTSRQGILREARRICEGKGVPLSTEATDRRFDRASDRELAAALWLVWLDRGKGETVTHPLGRGAAWRRDAFLLYWDEGESVTYDHFSTTEAAEERLAEVSDEFEGSLKS
jgi:hypothetical protein